ncbi:HAD-IIA family hydrolase [Candidatus Gracilibacteria bacterium]|nr:HAD-IIA family hydrolase [Candidatus Gracilibacteria bacterium]
MDFSFIRTVLFDMDGVLYRGRQVLPGVHELLAFLDAQNVSYGCLTNNSTQTPVQYEQKLAAMGLHIPATHIVTSAMATARYLRQEYPAGTTIYMIGMSGLHEVLFSDGHFIESDLAPMLVVQGGDFEITYEKLRKACLAIRGGARYVLTNPDSTYPTEEGLVPGAGALAAALQAATEVEPFVIGKPGVIMFQVAVELLGGNNETTLMIGDRIDTDIVGASHADLHNALVLTGVSTRADIAENLCRPEVVVENLIDLLALWQRDMA